jgi:hypothetical protein
VNGCIEKSHTTNIAPDGKPRSPTQNAMGAPRIGRSSTLLAGAVVLAAARAARLFLSAYRRLGRRIWPLSSDHRLRAELHGGGAIAYPASARTMAPVVTAFQAMRGLSLVNATVVAETGNIRRFDQPR